jgi:CheY-like chemotaxis protein
MKRALRTILVVDDDTSLIKLLEKRLPVDGYRVISAVDGEAALKKAKDELPDLIVLDLMMPQMNGTEVAKKLKGMRGTKDIPLIFITATLGVENDKGDEEIIIDDYSYRIFAKPLHNPKLLSVIRKSINRRENKQS